MIYVKKRRQKTIAAKKVERSRLSQRAREILERTRLAMAALRQKAAR